MKHLLKNTRGNFNKEEKLEEDNLNFAETIKYYQLKLKLFHFNFYKE